MKHTLSAGPTKFIKELCMALCIAWRRIRCRSFSNMNTVLSVPVSHCQRTLLPPFLAEHQQGVAFADRSDSAELKRAGTASTSTSRTGSDASQQSMHDSVCSFEQGRLPASKAKAQHGTAANSSSSKAPGSHKHAQACAEMSSEQFLSDDQLMRIPRR